VAKRRKKIQPVVDIIVESKYYAYYDDVDGKLISVSNQTIPQFDHSIEVTLDEYSKLVTGVHKFIDYHVGVVIDAEGNPVKGLVSNQVAIENTFKNRLLAWIDSETDLADIEIHWDQFNKQWIFVASDDLRQQYYDNKLPNTSVSFFITLGQDPNFLLRTIDIDFKTITLDKVAVGFESKYEERIKDVAVTSNLATLDYSLKIWSTVIE
jgi:hypothetical protein